MTRLTMHNSQYIVEMYFPNAYNTLPKSDSFRIKQTRTVQYQANGRMLFLRFLLYVTL